jgi:hypothetical protein
MAGFPSAAHNRAITRPVADNETKTIKAIELGEGPFFLIRPVPGIFDVNGPLDVLDLSSLLVHLIRIQRNVLADPSADAVAIRITVQIIAVLIAHVAATVTGHALQQFWDFLGDPVSLSDLSGKKVRRESSGSRITGNRRQTPGLAPGKKEEQAEK